MQHFWCHVNIWEPTCHVNSMGHTCGAHLPYNIPRHQMRNSHVDSTCHINSDGPTSGTCHVTCQISIGRAHIQNPPATSPATLTVVGPICEAQRHVTCHVSNGRANMQGHLSRQQWWVPYVRPTCHVTIDDFIKWLMQRLICQYYKQCNTIINKQHHLKFIAALFSLYCRLVKILQQLQRFCCNTQKNHCI